MRFATAALVAVCVSACTDSKVNRGGQRDLGGTLVVAATQDPGPVFPPFVVSLLGREVSEQIYDYLADVGPGLNTRGDKGFRRGLSDGWRWSTDSLSIAFHINPAARWHDGVRVTAQDVVFTHHLNQNPDLAGGMLGALPNIDSVTAIDSLTAVFWFHELLPTQFLDAAAQLPILPAHQLEALSPRALRETPPPPLGTGRFRFDKRTVGTSIQLLADTANFRGRAKLDRVIWIVQPDFPAAVTQLLGGSADLFETLRPENLRDVTRKSTLRVLTLPASDYGFLQFNLRDPANPSRPHPLFGDRSLRRALTMAMDRVSLVKSVFDTLAAVPVGPTIRAFPTTDSSLRQLPFDTVRAKAILDSLGWRQTAPGRERSRDGQALAFSVIVPISSLNRVRMASLIQEQMRRVGVRVSIETMDIAAHGARLVARKFDSSLGSWHLGSSPDGTRDGWSSSGIRSEGRNYGSYANPIFDRQLDSALRADGARAKALFSHAYRTINEDAPAVWLYEPRTLIGLHRRLKTAETRPDAWWFDLADWSVPASERIPRDKLGLTR
jgi:peptide/nickel transport system substrate-binding protein